MSRRKHSRLTYALEMCVIRLRDHLRSPAGILQEAGVSRGMTVLDFGCGPGGFSLAAAEIVGPEGKVYALDRRPEALEHVCRAVAERGRLPVIATLHAEDVPAGSADMALLYDVIHIPADADERRAILAALHRALKSGGVLSVRDHHLRGAELEAAVTEGGFFRASGRTPRQARFAKAAVEERTT